MLRHRDAFLDESQSRVLDMQTVCQDTHTGRPRCFLGRMSGPLRITGSSLCMRELQGTVRCVGSVALMPAL